MKVFSSKRSRPLVTVLIGFAVLVTACRFAVAAEPSSADVQATAISRDSRNGLEALVDEALQRSPTIEAARHRWESSAKVPVQVSTLPDPQIGLQEFTVGGPRPLEGYETSDFYYTGFGVSQDIPWPSKLGWQAEQAKKQSEYAHQTYEAARRETAEKVRESYFELFFLKKALAILGETRGELHRIEKVTEARYRLGQAQEQDLSKSQLEMTSILEQIEINDDETGRRQAELKATLGRDPDSPDIEVGDIAPSNLNLDAPQLQQLPLEKLSIERSPELKMAEAMEAGSADALKLARANYYPDLSVGYAYQKTGPGLRDYYMLTVGAKIPLYFWRKQTPAVEQAALDNRAAHSETRARELEVSAAARSQAIAIRTAGRVMTLYRDGLIPQAKATRDAALNGYRVGKVDFQTLLSAVIDSLNMNQAYYRALADHEIAAAKLHQIVGDAP